MFKLSEAEFKKYFEVLDFIDSGANSSVHLVQHKILETRYALKKTKLTLGISFF